MLKTFLDFPRKLLQQRTVHGPVGYVTSHVLWVTRCFGSLQRLQLLVNSCEPHPGKSLKRQLIIVQVRRNHSLAERHGIPFA